MRTWTRAQGPMLCGLNPQHQIERGDPVLLIRIEGIEKRRFRCHHCAGEPIPSDLPALEEQPVTPVTSAVVHRRSVPERLSAIAGVLPLDWRQRATGEREPGEEG